MSALRVLTDVSRTVKILWVLTIAGVIVASGWIVIDVTVMVRDIEYYLTDHP